LFKENLHNYREYSSQVQIKEFADKTEIARDKESMTIADNFENRITFKDVVYVSKSSDQILFLMKLQREKNVDFYFTTVEEFVIFLSNDAFFKDKSINDICHIRTSFSL